MLVHLSWGHSCSAGALGSCLGEFYLFVFLSCFFETGFLNALTILELTL